MESEIEETQWRLIFLSRARVDALNFRTFPQRETVTSATQSGDGGGGGRLRATRYMLVYHIGRIFARVNARPRNNISPAGGVRESGDSLSEITARLRPPRRARAGVEFVEMMIGTLL